MLFTYNKLSIDSAIPLQEILDYFDSIGVVLSSEGIFSYCGLEIQLIPKESQLSSSFNIPRHEIVILSGERQIAENFLTNFRLRFLSAGG